MKYTIYTVSWSFAEYTSTMIDYISARDSKNALVQIVDQRSLINEEGLNYLRKIRNKLSLHQLIKYLKDNYGLTTGVRTTPDYEDINMEGLTYIKGDATYPQTSNKVVIPHICNNIGDWGSGFVIAVSKRWPEPKQVYRDLFLEKGLKMGDVQFVKVEDDKYVFNMVAQNGVKSSKNSCPISYDALSECLDDLYDLCEFHKLEVHCPKFGSDRAGGNWRVIEELIIEKLVNKGIQVFVYEFEG